MEKMMQLLFAPDKFHETVEDIEYHPIGNMLPEEEDLLTVMMDDLDLTELPDYADDYDLFGMELDTGPDDAEKRQLPLPRGGV
ncbi:hypothetical protein YC2023_089820 [Brassica napus]